MYVSGRIRSSRRKRSASNCSKRHESQQPWLQMEQFRNGSRKSDRKTCRTIVFFTEELKTKSEELKATNKNHGQWTTDHCPLTMMYFQEALEATCWQQGNMRQTAPSQRMMDFTRKKLSYDLPDSSYSPGLVSSPLHFWMPTFITSRLIKGFQQIWEKQSWLSDQ